MTDDRILLLIEQNEMRCKNCVYFAIKNQIINLGECTKDAGYVWAEIGAVDPESFFCNHFSRKIERQKTLVIKIPSGANLNNI